MARNSDQRRKNIRKSVSIEGDKKVEKENSKIEKERDCEQVKREGIILIKKNIFTKEMVMHLSNQVVNDNRVGGKKHATKMITIIVVEQLLHYLINS